LFEYDCLVSINHFRITISDFIVDSTRSIIQSINGFSAHCRKLDVGALAINAGPGFRSDTAPFGGVKESGLGREGVGFAVKEMQYLKTMYW
jgi:acyl-CoA reductase-like NAD-dependent aldehyde dehydrogenase